MKLLLTGAGGAIGIHMLDAVLNETNWQVIATDSFRHKGHFDRIARLLADQPCHRDRVEILHHDLIAPFTDREIARLSDVDYIINLASLSDVEDSIQNPVPFIMNNTALMVNMLELARNLPSLKQFIQFSTDEVCGPDTERGHGHPEWDTVIPSNPYSASKAAQEAIAISYWRSYGVPLVITRTMNNFGEMQGADKYPVKIQKAISSGDTVQVHAAGDGQIGSRFYIHSRMAAEAVLFIMRNTEPYKHRSGHIDRPDMYNVVGDVQRSNLELAEDIAALMGEPLTYDLVNFHADRPGHDLHYGLDGSKLRDLGWSPSKSYKEMLARTIEWQKNNPEWV